VATDERMDRRVLMRGLLLTTNITSTMWVLR